MMHVAMVTLFPDLPNKIDGGVAGVSKYLADAMVRKADIRLSIIVPQATRGRITHKDWEHYRVYKCGRSSAFSRLPGTLYDVVAGKRELFSLLRRIDPDIVHFQGWAYRAADCEFPSVLTIHGIIENDARWERRGIQRWLRWLLLRTTERHGRRNVRNIIMISKYVADFMPKKKQSSMAWLVENPVAQSFFDVDWDCEPGRILCCSKVIARKNILGLMSAFCLIVKRFPHAQLRIAGSTSSEPAYVAKCRALAQESRLGDRVCFLGVIDIGEVQQELEKANCLVLPSFQETAPLTIEEAMAVGVPVVASNLCGIPYLVDDRRTGLLIDPVDSGHIAEAVCRVLSDDAMAASMSQHAKDTAEARFTASHICDQTIEIYRRILAGER